MKKTFILLLAAIWGMSLGAVSSFAQSQGRGVGSLSAPGATQPGVIYENSYAIVVGVDRYEDISIRPLNYAVADAEAIARLIQKLGFPQENITMLYNEEATRENFIKTFTEISEQTGENDRLLVYWAGHGQSERVALGEEGYLIPYDAESDGLAYSALSMDMISGLSRRPLAKHQLFLVDACYGGLAASTRGGASSKPARFLLDAMTRSKAIQIITAGGKDQEVVESPEWGHSAFTKALMEALDDRYADFNKDNLITADELYTFLKDRVVKLSSSVSNRPHYPIRGRFDNAEGEFIFVTEDFNSGEEEAPAPADELPDWYLNPPNDTEEWLYAVSSSETLRDALIMSLQYLAEKIQTKAIAIRHSFSDSLDLGYSSFDGIVDSENSEVLINQKVGDIQVSALTKNFSQVDSSADQTTYYSQFSNATEIKLLSEEGYYEARLFMEETVEGGETDFITAGSESGV